MNNAANASPSVSVVMSAFNNRSYVQAAVDSILRQTFGDFEFIIIDDGSSDGTTDLLRRAAAADARVRLVVRANKGLTASLNEGLALARGEFVARMDSDDVACPDRFAHQVAFLQATPDCVAVGAQVVTIGPFDSPIARPVHQLEHDAIDRELLEGVGWALVHPVVMFRAEAIRAVGGYREKYDSVEDLDLFLRLAEIGRLANLSAVLLHYRQHLGSVNHRKFEQQRRLKVAVLDEAYRRRGLAVPAQFHFRDPEYVDQVEQHRIWGWRALKEGHSRAARQHALAALRAKPADWGSFRLLLSALRPRGSTPSG